MGRIPETILLFDVDGTLTKSRQLITREMFDFLRDVMSDVAVALVGGSDLCKIEEQMGGATAIEEFDYVFAENGLVSLRKGKEFARESLLHYVGEEKLQEFINFCLHYIADLKLPQKRGTFVEFRNGMINISPIGRNCSQTERENFEKYDHEHQVRPAFVKVLRERFAHIEFQYSIGGQISFDVFPKGWDKTYCLQHLLKDGYKVIHFFGDKTWQGGNDHEIFVDPRTIGHSVKSPDDTKAQVQKLLTDLKKN
uniref:Phosphomannomutase n=1 Tax=Ornithodoros turicata TaxID=34597 RepID=A0A2R5L8Q1_9ACAR